MRVAAAIALLAALCLGHGATTTTPPPTNDPNAKPTPPPDDTRDPSKPGGRRGGRRGPSTPPKGPSPPSGPSAPDRGGGGRTPATETKGPAEWQTWWERNREYVVKMRSLLRRSTVITGSRKAGPRDPMKEKRDAILVTLRCLAREAQHRSLRASAVMALGRMGGNEDALLFLRLLQDSNESTAVREFASVALALMGDRREEDVLFDLDAYFNLYATTGATHELMRLY